MKKVVKYLLVFMFSFLLIAPNTFAMTIKEYRKELADLEKQKSDSIKNAAEIERNINKTNEEIRVITHDIERAVKEQNDLESQVKDLEKEIANKEQEIKDLVSFYQVSDSQNFYLKYLFGSESFTDFIYRFSVIEQLTSRNDELVKEMNDLIVKNKNKIKELDAKKAELKELNETAHKKLIQYADRQTKYNNATMDYDTQIKQVKEKIDKYKKAGCGETQNLSTCMNTIPFDFGFIRPLKTGFVSDEYGMRKSPISGVWKNHNGIDLAAGEGSPIYAPAAGKVVDIMRRQSCGGNILVLNHVVNGKAYTTRYLHMLSIDVKDGDIVEKGEKIGTVGGGRTSTAWGGYDRCTTGAHLHFEMATGHYYGEDSRYTRYAGWYTYLNHLFNPREMLYFPAYGVRWYGN